MRGLILNSGLTLSKDLPEPSLGAHEARIEVIQAGICSTDLHLAQGYMAFEGVLGHEFVGQVHDTADPSWKGKRVVGEINASCRSCDTCVAGRPTHCPHRTTLGIQGRDGAFADYLSLPVANLFEVPNSVTNDQAVFVEPLAAACEITQLVSVQPTDRVLIIGDGKLGILCAQVLALFGCEISLLGRHPDSHSWLTPKGITVTSDPKEIAPEFDIVVEATGSPDGLFTASQLVRARGTIVLKSTYHGHISLNLTEFVIKEVSLIGSRCGPFAPAIRLLEAGHVQVDPLIHAHYSLNDGIEAMNNAAQPGTLKVMIHMA